MNRLIQTTLALLTVTLGAACSCGGGGITPAAFPDEAAKVMCTRTFECCTAAEMKDNESFGPDVTACEKKVKAGIATPSRLKDSEGKGRLIFHGDRASECLTSYKALSCEQQKTRATSAIAICDAFIEPKVAIGGACQFNDECIASSCEGAGFGTDGTCAAFLPENAGCNDGGTCDKNLYCANTCRQLKADGTPCNFNFECSTGGCNGKDAGVAGTCGQKGGPGTTCYATNGCSAVDGSMLAVLALLGTLMRTRARSKAQRV